jgi:hypothetical protein
MNLTLPLSDRESAVNVKNGGDMLCENTKKDSKKEDLCSTDSGIAVSSSDIRHELDTGPGDHSSVSPLRYNSREVSFIRDFASYSCPASPTTPTTSKRQRCASAESYSIQSITSTVGDDSDSRQSSSVIEKDTTKKDKFLDQFDREFQLSLLQNPALQYVTNKEDFTSLILATIYSPPDYLSVHCSTNFTISNERFRQAQQLLRAEALEQIKNQCPHPKSREDSVDAEDLDTLTARPWLEYKCHLITGKKFNLELHKAEKEIFDTKYQKSFLLSDLNLAAVTHKSVTELEEELKKLASLDLNLLTGSYRCFTEIEKILLDYPQLAEPEAFKASLNSRLTALPSSHENQAAFQVDTEQAKLLLQSISRHIENDINNQWPLFKLNLNVNPPVATTGVNTLLQGVIENGKNTWNSIFLTPFAKKIYADISATFISDNNSLSESKAKELIVTAINLLRSHHGLKEKLQEREERNKDIKQHYAMLEAIQTCRSAITQRVDILEEGIKTKKSAPIKPIDSSLLSSVFVPSTYYMIRSSEEFHIAPTGTLFSRREPPKLRERINYAQALGNKNIVKWSLTRNSENSLAYHTKTAWYKKLGEKALQELAFSQMIDALNSFKNSKIIYFCFSPHCPKAAEKQYRLFISAYKGLLQESGKKAPLLYCSPNGKKLEIKKSEIAAAQAEIKEKLDLYAGEPKAAYEDLRTFQSSRHRG